jgi:mannose-6-phosphate isomerase-like protein (cupin superfamily)
MEFEHIHEDKRGAIKALTGTELLPAEEVTVFTTNCGNARGGCVHSESSEHICVLAGRIIFVIRGGDETADVEMNAGDSYTIPKNTPHYFYSITDSVVMEWGPKISEKGERDVAFRKIVDTINEEAK